MRIVILFFFFFLSLYSYSQITIKLTTGDFIIENAKVYKKFEDSISDLNFLIGTSARKRFVTLSFRFLYDQKSVGRDV